LKIWQYDVGKSMMSALGFGKPFNTVSPNGQTRTVLGLKLLPQDLNKISELPHNVQSMLIKKRFELEEELVALEGSPSVSAAVRELRTRYTVDEVRIGVETVLTIVRNVLTQPRDIRMYRIKRGNPTFHRNLGRLDGSALLMNAVGFVAGGGNFGQGESSTENIGSLYILKALNSERGETFDATSVIATDTTKGTFQFELEATLAHY